MFVFVNSSYAASGTISVFPSSGNFDQGSTFDAEIVIDGGGENFNASEATVSVSNNLKVNEIVLGDCGFAYVTTPTITSLSYAGVILGGSEASCTAYSLKLQSIGGGSGFIYISDGSIKSFDGAVELLENTSNGSYVIGGEEMQVNSISQAPTQAPNYNQNGERLYKLVYTVTELENYDDVLVSLDQSKPSAVQQKVEPLPENPSVMASIFTNVTEGVHTIDVTENGKVLSSEIVNVTGDNNEVNLGVKADKQEISIAGIGLGAIALIVVITIIVLGVLFYKRKKVVVDENNS